MDMASNLFKSRRIHIVLEEKRPPLHIIGYVAQYICKTLATHQTKITKYIFARKVQSPNLLLFPNRIQ